jgi:hypothetical protein
VQAQSLKDILGGLIGAVKENATTEQTIVGEWGYTKPAIALKSDNILAQAGSSLMVGTKHSILIFCNFSRIFSSWKRRTRMANQYLGVVFM